MGGMGQVFIFVTCVLLPWMVIKSVRAVSAGAAPITTYRRHITTALVVQVFVLLLALGAAQKEQILLFPRARFALVPSLAAAGLLVAMLATIPLRARMTSPELRERRLRGRPRNGRELVGWAVLSLGAGVGEEIAYRGTLFWLIFPWMGGNGVAAALFCSLVFALAHATQGWVTALFIFAFTLGLHWIVWETGNLYTVMIVHAAYDFLAGVVYVVWGSRLAAPHPAIPKAVET